MSSDLSPENEKFIESQVATGAFSSRNAAIEAGVELLRKRDSLVNRIRESRRQLDSGEYKEYNEDSLEARFDELRARIAKKQSE